MTTFALRAAASFLLAALPASGVLAQVPTAAEILAQCGAPTGSSEVWSWWGPRDAPDFPAFCGTPLIVQVTDDDGDGLVTAADVADVVIVHDAPAIGESRLSVLDGRTGAVAWTSPVPVGLRMAAAADVDLDGRVEFAALRPARDGVILLDHDGSLLWDTAVPPPDLTGCAPGFADFDQDGVPEIHAGAAVLSAAGMLRHRGTLGQGGLLSERVTHAVDVHPSPGLELIAGNTLHAADGTVLWSNPALPDGFTAVGDVTGDGSPEILLSGISFLHAVRPLDGTTMAVAFLDSDRPLSSPLLADFDGDGRLEVFVASQSAAVLLAFDPVPFAFEERWRRDIVDLSCCSGASAFDFDGDGSPEILYRDEHRLRVFDALTGAVLWDRGGSSGTGIEVPQVVDLEGDGSPEIITAGCGSGVQVYACPCPSRPRRIWNQQAYRVTNVADDGSVPAVQDPVASWGVQSGGPVEPCVIEPPLLECATCADLYRTVNEAEIDVEGVRTSLLAKVDAACRALERNRRNAAANVLAALLAETSAQDGRHVSVESAQDIRECVTSFADANHLALRQRRRR